MDHETRMNAQISDKESKSFFQLIFIFYHFCSECKKELQEKKILKKNNSKTKSKEDMQIVSLCTKVWADFKPKFKPFCLLLLMINTHTKKKI